MPGCPFQVRASIMRPANTTQYTAKDVVNGSVAEPMRFKWLTPFPGMGYWILSPVLISSNAPTTTGNFKLLLFSQRPTAPIDHAVFAPEKPELAYLIGFVSFDNAIKISTGTIYVPSAFSPIWGQCLANDQDIFGVLLDDAAYTPASTETFQIVLNGQWE